MEMENRSGYQGLRVVGGRVLATLQGWHMGELCGDEVVLYLDDGSGYTNLYV